MSPASPWDEEAAGVALGAVWEECRAIRVSGMLPALDLAELLASSCRAEGFGAQRKAGICSRVGSVTPREGLEHFQPQPWQQRWWCPSAC